MNEMNLLKKAHELTKEIKREYPEVDYKAQLGICISFLYNNKEVEEMVKLKGTEKQVKWAEDIRKEMIEDAKETIERINNSGKQDNRVNKMFLLRCNNLLERINIETSAVWYINNRDHKAQYYGLSNFN